MSRELRKAKAAALEVQVRQMAVLGAVAVRDQAIVAAAEAGHTGVEIASVVELSAARVGQIIADASEASE